MDDSATPPTPVLDRLGARLRRLSMRGEALRLRLTPRVVLTERIEADAGEPDDWSFLKRPGPARLRRRRCPSASAPRCRARRSSSRWPGGTWFFGETGWPSTSLMLPGVVAVYGGHAALRAGLVRPLPALTRAPGRAHQVVGLDARPVVGAHARHRPTLQPGRLLLRRPGRDDEPPHQPVPLRARDPRDGSVRVGGRPPVGQHAGPLRAALPPDRRAGRRPLSLHHELATVVLLRLWSVAGVALIAYCIPRLARLLRDGAGPVFMLAVLNPLTLLALVGGAHNDALMVGLLLAGHHRGAQPSTPCGASSSAPWPRPSRCPPPSASSTSAGTGLGAGRRVPSTAPG